MRTRMTARERVESEVQEIISAARNVIRAAEEIPDATATEDDATAAQLAEAEAVMREIYQRQRSFTGVGEDARAIRDYFRKYHSLEVLL